MIWAYPRIFDLPDFFMVKKSGYHVCDDRKINAEKVISLCGFKKIFSGIRSSERSYGF